MAVRGRIKAGGEKKSHRTHPYIKVILIGLNSVTDADSPAVRRAPIRFLIPLTLHLKSPSYFFACTLRLMIVRGGRGRPPLTLQEWGNWQETT